MKEQRQTAILNIIRSRDIETQEQLLQALQERGIRCTQATISRDIRELRLVKELGRGGSYHYVDERPLPRSDLSARLQTIFREGVTSFDHAQNLVVLKTMPGLANAAAAALDGMDLPNVLGSLAGDDTVLLIMRTGEDASAFCRDLHSMVQ